MSKMIHPYQISHYARIINNLEEEHTYCLKLALLGYGDELCISNHGWKHIEGFKFDTKAEREIAQKFIEDFNSATKPIIDRFIKDLREALARRCLELAAEIAENTKS